MKRHGSFKSFYIDGTVKTIDQYNDDKSVGEHKEYFQNGHISMETGYDSDHTKYHRIYFESGQIKSESFGGYLSINPNKNGVITRHYFENGNVEFEQLFINRNVSEHNHFFEDGELKKTTIYNYSLRRNRRKSAIAYHPNGQRMYEGKYDEKIQNEFEYDLWKKPDPDRKEDYDRKGQWVWFYENGMLQKTKFYNDGERHGDWIWYYSKGMVKKINRFKDGKPNGIWIEFKDDGTLFRWTEFKDGKVYNGKSKFLLDRYSLEDEDDGNRLIKRADLMGGDYWGVWMTDFRVHLKEKPLYYDEKVRVLTKVNIQAGKKEGMECKYHRNGEKRSISYYKSGNLDGEVKLFYPNGELKSICHYKNGIPHGDLTVYFENQNSEDESIVDNRRKPDDKVCKNKQGEFDHYHKYTTTHEYHFDIDGNLLFKSEIIPEPYDSYFKDVISEGQAYSYFNTGNILESGIYVNDRPESIWTVYDTNGSEIGRGSYINGKPWEGLIVRGDASYILIGRYLKGEKIGEWKEYDRNGTFLKILK